ncbi:TatD family hydrolase [Candidatus Dojkabacteria bacterium]|uniref:TatD family hydrolase n=1 Tax=Candidatus Dojkabacteria bacterium TaxID=2099670 RepID=A0A955L1H0_9BACT|nr:TatD family hydrolase [Candidatus Dojkabacteria bacterium]
MITDKNILIDSHCHINFGGYDEIIEDILKRCAENSIEQVWDIGTDINSSKKSISMAKEHPEIKSFIGIDPEVFVPGSEYFVGFDKNDEWIEQMFNELNNLIEENKDYVIGIGESGLDHYWFKEKSKEDQENSSRLQEQLFKMHLELARKHNLPLSIHSRGAEKLCLEIVRKYNVTGIFHSFTGNYQTAKGILDAGWGLGVNGIVTFKNSNDLREVYKKLLSGRKFESPIDFYNQGIFFETDSPFLAPEGKRGEQNEPYTIALIYDNFIKNLSF